MKTGALTMVEVMLALCVVALGIFAGVEMMARVVAAQGGQSAWSGWERRLRAVREKMDTASADEVAAKVSGGGVWQMEGASVRASQQQSPYPAAAQELTVRLEGATGENLAEVEMLKVKEGL